MKKTIYLVTNTVNGMWYVGMTVRPLFRRWREHRQDAKSGRGWALHDAIRRYGAENFEVSVLFEGEDWEILSSKEQDFIHDLNTLSPSGYNLTLGGEGKPGRRVSPETRAKISAGHKGKTLSVEHRAKLSAAKLGKKRPPRSDDHCAKISEGLRRAWKRRKAA